MITIFPRCFFGDTIDDIVERVKREDLAFIVVVDENNKYKGVIESRYILEYTMNNSVNRDDSIRKLVKMIQPVSQDDDIRTLKNIEEDINVIPVVNSSLNVLGYISLNSILKSIDKINNKSNSIYLGTNKDNSKIKAKYTIDHFIGESKPILQLKKRILAAAKTKATVLVTGETGTGKELVAHAITSLGDRRHQPFVRLNCAAIPENLLESELFGYEEGAFTGALKGGNSGKFTQANHGTIFLDEIGDMPLALQAKILRVLQEREVEKIGGTCPVPIDIRVIAATHTNLIELVKQNRFRQDLFYRLHVIPINVPPLRDRKEDIPLLVGHFIQQLSDEMEMEKPIIEVSFLKALIEYHWPGNVRELLNVLQMALSFSEGRLTDDTLKEYLLLNGKDSGIDKDDLKSVTNEVEKDKIINAMKIYGGNKIKVASALGISRSNLYYKMKKYNL